MVPRLVTLVVLGLLGLGLAALAFWIPIVGWSLIALTLTLVVLNLLAPRDRPSQNQVDPYHRSRPGMFED